MIQAKISIARLTGKLACGALMLVAAARAIVFLIYLLWIFSLRTEISPLESKMVHLAWRVQHGVRLYPEWTNGPHVANFFGPCYFALVGMLGRVRDVDIDGLTLVARAVTVASTLGMTLILGVYGWRRYGQGAGVLAACISLGSGAVQGFGVMARPDTLADLLGFIGFLLAIGSARARWWSGSAVLLVALFTKQTTVAYLVAAMLVQFLSGRRGVAVAIGGSVVLAAFGVIGMVTTTIEPRFAIDLFGEAKSPWNWTDYQILLFRMFLTSFELPVCALIGLLVWCLRPTRDLRFSVLAAVLTVSCFLSAGKKGADFNYFLPLRAVAALAAATLWSALHDARGGRAWALATATTTAAIALGFTLISMVLLCQTSLDFRNKLGTRFGQVMLRQYDDLLKLAEDRSQTLLTDSGPLDIRRGASAEFADPWLFRLLATTGRLHTTALRASIEEERYDWIITTKPLDAPDYDTNGFCLPPDLAAAARRHYIPAGYKCDLNLYRRRNRAVSRNREKGP
jgi:hypothetical protein